MKDLSRTSGLDIRLDTKKHCLVLGKGLVKVSAEIRYLKDIRGVLTQKDLSGPNELYYMYRDMHKLKDERAIRANKLRYDVTIIRADRLGSEFMKTAGHYHPGYFGELYEVLYGRAWCLLQKKNDKNPRIIDDVILVKAGAGDKIVIPPYYGHILINVGKEHLVTSNWVSSEFSSGYELYKQTHGATYYIFEDALGERFEANPYYEYVPKIRVATPAKIVSRFALASGEPIYPLLYRDAHKLDFLNNPLRYDYHDVFEFR
jgi:glucose-6-phosphate isomerase